MNLRTRQKDTPLTTIDTVRADIAALERDLAADDSTAKDRATLASLERQFTAATAAEQEATTAYAGLNGEAIDAAMAGTAYDRTRLEQARTALATATADARILGEALTQQRARVASLKQQRKDRAAARFEPVLTTALDVLSRAVEHVAEADAALARLQAIGDRAIGSYRTDLSGGWCFSTPALVALWRTRVAEWRKKRARQTKAA